MTKQDIQLARHAAQARINSMEAEKEFLQQLLNTPIDGLSDRIKNRIVQAGIQIDAERNYVNGLEHNA